MRGDPIHYTVPLWLALFNWIDDKHEQGPVDNRNMTESLLIGERNHRDHP